MAYLYAPGYITDSESRLGDLDLTFIGGSCDFDGKAKELAAEVSEQVISHRCWN